MISEAENIAEALDMRRAGKGWRGACPVHGGDHRSTSFSIRDDGDRVLWHCFAGCPGDAILEELQSRGLLPRAGAGPVNMGPQISRDAIAHAYYVMALTISDIRRGAGIDDTGYASEHAAIVRLYPGKLPQALAAAGWQEEQLQLTAMSIPGESP